MGKRIYIEGDGDGQAYIHRGRWGWAGAAHGPRVTQRPSWPRRFSTAPNSDATREGKGTGLDRPMRMAGDGEARSEPSSLTPRCGQGGRSRDVWHLA